MAIEKLRLTSPATVNWSAASTEPGTKPTSEEVLPTLAAVTDTVPPEPVVKLPKLSVAPAVCVSTIGEMTFACAEPAVVEVLPDVAA